MRQLTKQAAVILNRFTIPDTNLLGVGGESRVYALDDEHVLRIYHAGTKWDYIEQRRAFYAQLVAHQLPLAMPEVLTVNAWSSHIYTIEKRMQGRDFGQVLPNLRGADREKALTSFLWAAAQIGTVPLPDRPYGEFLTQDTPLQRASWADYLWDRMQQALAISYAVVVQEVPEFDQLLAYIRQELNLFDGFNAKRLVHGDYYPANVFVDDALNICGIGDFGYTTVVGDPVVDLAGTIIFLDVYEDNLPGDTGFLLDLLIAQHGPEIARRVQFYRLYYSVYFAGSPDPYAHRWSIRNLRAALATLAI